MVSIGIVFHVKKLNSKCNKAFVLIENIMNGTVRGPETVDLGVFRIPPDSTPQQKKYTPTNFIFMYCGYN